MSQIMCISVVMGTRNSLNICSQYTTGLMYHVSHDSTHTTIQLRAPIQALQISEDSGMYCEQFANHRNCGCNRIIVETE